MIKINGERWRVRLVPPSHPVLIYKHGAPAWGCCDDITKTIYLSQGLTKAELKEVLRHEIVHAFAYSYNLNMAYDVEETVAEFVATYGDDIITFTEIAFDKLK